MGPSAFHAQQGIIASSCYQSWTGHTTLPFTSSGLQLKLWGMEPQPCHLPLPGLLDPASGAIPGPIPCPIFRALGLQTLVWETKRKEEERERSSEVRRAGGR